MFRAALAVTLLAAGCQVALAQTTPLVLTPDEAMALALRDNPELAAQRQRLGIAAADVVIARSLPVNPQWTGEFRTAQGPASAGITSHFTTFHALLFTLQPHAARQARAQAAAAGLTKAEAEIAHLEAKLATAVYRATHEVVYRQERLTLAQRILERTEATSAKLAKTQKLVAVSQIDILLLRTDVADAKAQVHAARQAYGVAGQELRRLLGVTGAPLAVRGGLVSADAAWPEAELQALALQRRHDLRARHAAATEAEARLRLERANRFGNPAIGPSYEYNESRAQFVGVQFAAPVPLNTKRGEIQQREAELGRALLEARQTEVEIQIEVHAALEQWRQAVAEVAAYERDVLPVVRAALADADKLAQAGVEDADLAKVLEFHRRLIKGEEGALGARWNVIQARAALAAAVGDPALALDKREP